MPGISPWEDMASHVPTRSVVRTIFLLDIDCFFASVEMALRPELRGKPLCIGGHRADRGIVSCPNYEARGTASAPPCLSVPPPASFRRMRSSFRVTTGSTASTRAG